MDRKKIHNYGWISVPVLILVSILSLLLFQQQDSLNDFKNWQIVYRIQERETTWKEVHHLLGSIPATEADSESCLGFCSPSSFVWLHKNFDGESLWLQRKRLSSLSVERWCASFDKKHIKCWWHNDSGAKREMWLTLP